MADHCYFQKKTTLSAGTQCFAFNCFNYNNPELRRLRQISFHKFPNKEKEPERWNTWWRVSKREKPPGKTAMLCSSHFSSSDIDATGQIRRLRQGAVPSLELVDVPDRLKKRPAPSRTSDTSKRALMEDQSLVAVDGDVCAASVSQMHKEHAYGTSTALLKDKVAVLEKRVEQCQKNVKNSSTREKRTRSKLEEYISLVKEKNLINEELEQKLQTFSGIPEGLFGLTAGKYTNDQQKFALTMHLYSPKAYEFLRKHVTLPAPRSLRRWLEGIDCKPGINVSVLECLRVKRNENPDEYTHCCLMLDAMSIRKMLWYDKQSRTMLGYCDLGYGPEEDGKEASEALVFMLTGLRSSWKAPVAFFFTASLTAETQRQLLVHTIEALQQHGFSIACVTMDGHASNLGMCRGLGAKMNLRDPDVQPYFTCNGKKVFILFDPCHMVKLVRNLLHSFGTIMSNSHLVKWSFIQELQDVQTVVGLRLANKLTSRHVNFQQSKMKVNLATQVLSASVADALLTLNQLGLPQFQRCDATVEFIQRIDRLFDILNSRSVMAFGFKRPLRLTSMECVTPFLLETRAYLMNLKTVEGIPLYTTKRHVCITGLVCAIDTVLGLVDSLLKPGHLQYLLMYKFSQDHLELFFNAVRRCGGWNNNPSVVQFQSIFRRLVTRCGVSPGTTGNVKPLDETALIQGTTYLPPTVIRDHADELEDPFEVENLKPEELLNITTHPVLGNITVYISGWVVRKVLLQLSCDPCRLAVIQSKPTSKYEELYLFLRLKNHGGLISPSDGVVTTVLCTEKYLKEAISFNRPMKYVNILRSVKAEVAKYDIFELKEHCTDTAVGIDNHHFSLLTLIVKIYFDLRQHYLAKIKNLNIHKVNVRQNATKSVLFRGQ